MTSNLRTWIERNDLIASLRHLTRDDCGSIIGWDCNYPTALRYALRSAPYVDSALMYGMGGQHGQANSCARAAARIVFDAFPQLREESEAAVAVRTGRATFEQRAEFIGEQAEAWLRKELHA